MGPNHHSPLMVPNHQSPPLRPNYQSLPMEDITHNQLTNMVEKKRETKTKGKKQTIKYFLKKILFQIVLSSGLTLSTISIGWP